MASRILISGSSGLIGAALLPSLAAQGYEITRLVRGVPSGESQIHWDPLQPLRPEAVSGFDAVVHLAGETIANRWTPARKAQIRESRVQGTRHIAQALAKTSQRPRVFISASAIGFYGDRGDEVLREDSLPGSGFLSEVCGAWEAATQPAADAGIRTVQIRTGVVLSSRGGALPKMLPPFKMGAGGRLGGGRQWMSWIDLEDVVGAVHHILQNNTVQGPLNLVAPSPVTNAEFTKTLAAVLSRPAIFPLPAFAVRLMFGEMGEELLLGSQRAEPAKLVASAYTFRFGELKASLEHVLAR